MSFLLLSKISKCFGPTVALEDVDFELRRGEVHALIGENGAGKSTLMNVLAGAHRPDTGTMELGGHSYVPTSPLDARRQGIALIHQELALFPHLSVTENILMGMESSHWGWVDHDACRRRALEVLESFHHPEIRPGRPVSELPIAASQIVEICRAIAAQARIILMDEPTSSLQGADVQRLFSLIRHLSQQGISVIYISHFLEEVRAVADRCTVLRDGRTVNSGDLSSVTDPELVAQMVGRPVANLFPPRIEPAPSETVLRVTDLVAPPDVEDASFELRRGEILGIAGLIGSGRTEMVRSLFGLARLESGSIRFGEAESSSRSGNPLGRIKQGIGFLSEDRRGEGLAVALSVADNVTLSRLSACSRWGWLALDCQARLAQALVTRLNIKVRTPFQPTWTLSGGNQQKVALARLLHQDADVLLLDEPTRGIDIGSKVQIYEAIARCAAENKAVLMVSSYLPELFGLCHRLAVMSRGRLSETRPINLWSPESVMRAAIEGVGS